MRRPESLCSNCTRSCSLRSDRIHYCDAYRGPHGEGLGHKRPAAEHLLPLRPRDVGLPCFYEP